MPIYVRKIYIKCQIIDAIHNDHGISLAPRTSLTSQVPNPKNTHYAGQQNSLNNTKPLELTTFSFLPPPPPFNCGYVIKWKILRRQIQSEQS